jgi:hypothetical protein
MTQGTGYRDLASLVRRVQADDGEPGLRPSPPESATTS